MTATRLIAAAALSIAATAPAFAQEATPDTWMNIHSSLTRAEVIADLQAAESTGSLQAQRLGYIPPVTTQLSRAQVRAQTLAAIDSGEVAAINARARGFSVPAVMASEPAMAANGSKAHAADRTDRAE